jgi:hypothetical protein
MAPYACPFRTRMWWCCYLKGNYHRSNQRPGEVPNPITVEVLTSDHNVLEPLSLGRCSAAILEAGWKPALRWLARLRLRDYNEFAFFLSFVPMHVKINMQSIDIAVFRVSHPVKSASALATRGMRRGLRPSHTVPASRVSIPGTDECSGATQSDEIDSRGEDFIRPAGTQLTDPAPRCRRAHTV